MTDQHPITPPPELVQQWCLHSNKHETADQFWRHIATQAAQWGSDQELEACAQWVRERRFGGDGQGWSWATSLRAARRPKPPNLKEQALALVSRRIGDGFLQMLTDADAEISRQAREALPND